MKIDRGINPQEYNNLKNNHERLCFLISLASLAPSSHNMQPWKFEIESDRIIHVIADKSRRLYVADPQGREFAVTLGTLLGTMKMVADCYGLTYNYTIFEDLADKVATFEFQDLNAKQIDAKYLKALIGRHNSRLPFEEKPLPEEFLSVLETLPQAGVKLHLVSDSGLKSHLKPVVLESIRVAFQDKGFRNELYPWLKPSVGAHEDGLVGKNLGMPLLVSLIFPSMTRFFDISALQVKIHTRMLNNVPVFGVLTTKDDIAKEWLQVGMSFQKIAVEAEKNGISIGVMQGGVESKNHRSEIQRILGIEDKMQMFFRLGFCDKVHYHSPRRPLSKILVQ